MRIDLFLPCLAENPAILISLLALIISLFAATQSFRSANTANQSLLVSNRAYVDFARIDATRLVDVPDGAVVGWRLAAVFKNNGKTPASDMRAGVNAITILRNSLPDWFSFPDAGSGAAVGLHIAPGQEHSVVPGLISAQLIRAVQEGERTLIIYGWCDYRDAFGVLRHVKFAQAVEEINGQPDHLTAPFEFVLTPMAQYDGVDLPGRRQASPNDARSLAWLKE